MKVINDFRGEYYFLNGLYNSPIEYNGLNFVCSESAFFAQKFDNSDVRELFTKLDGIDACKEEEKWKPRDGWEELETAVMYNVTWCKFTQNEKLKRMLLDTEDAFLIDVNDYGDEKWGIYNGKGDNRRGFILMNIRSRLKLIEENGEESHYDVMDSLHYDLLERWKVDFEFSTDEYKQAIIDKFIDSYGYDELLFLIFPVLCEMADIDNGEWDEEIDYISQMEVCAL